MLSDIEQIADFEEILRLAIEGRLADVWTCLPGIVESANLDAQTCVVQPAIQSMIEDEDGATRNVTLPLLVDVSIGFFSTSAGALTFPIGKGDEVIVLFSCRCIDAFWQSGEVSAQMELRMHDLSDAIAIPSRISQAKKLTNLNPNNIQLRNGSGDTMLEIEPSGRVRALAATEISLSVGGSSVSVSSSGVDISGDVSVSGTLSANSVTAGGIGLASHIHTAPSGGGPTGGAETGPEP